MRIAFIAPFGLRVKGTTRARALPLARALAQRGHAVALFIPPYDSPEDSGDVWEEDGVRVVNVSLPDRCPRQGALWHLGVGWRLLLAVRRWRPDLVHVFKPKGPSGLVGAALWVARPEVTERGGAIPRRNGWCRLVIDSDDWEGSGGWNDDPRAGYTALQRRFFAWQERYGLSHADAWTVTSTCLRDRAVSFGAKSTQVFLLPNGVTAFDAVSASVAGGPRAGDRHGSESPARAALTILYTRFAGVRVQEVAGIWERVRDMVPHARLAVVGRGLAGEEQSLRDLPGIDVCGWLEPQARLRLFAESALAIVPWADTPSNRARHSAKVLELMASGLPVVAYAVGELPATLGDAGILVPPGEQSAFVAAAVAVIRNPELARPLGTAARSRVLTFYSWSSLVDTALVAYRATGLSQLIDEQCKERSREC
jgi:glycosyltransferase involved in cell wall biosynthesis